MFGFRSTLEQHLAGLLVLAVITFPVFADAIYIIQPGDTLLQLSQRFAISVPKLLAMNRISNPDLLYVGTPLVLTEGPLDAMTTSPLAIVEAPPAAIAETGVPGRALTGRELIAARTRWLTEQQAARARATTARQGQSVVTAASRYFGTPYVWGGLSSRGLDCSGLVVRAMAAQGVDVPHHAAALARMGQPVRYPSLRPGDLVFFNTTGKGVSHVGIWVGNNKFIHASSGRREVVEEKLVGYYAQRLVGARRIAH